jgi:hypothetical protein
MSKQVEIEKYDFTKKDDIQKVYDDLFQEIQPSFDASEHSAIGNQVIKIVSENLQDDSYEFWTIKKDNKVYKIPMRYLVALAGDFFTSKESIKDGGEFKKITDALEQADPEHIQRVLIGIKLEEDAVADAIKNGESPKKAIEKLAPTLNRLWNAAHTDNPILKNIYKNLFPIIAGDYLHNQKNNKDHFEEAAKESYKKGHEEALQLAKQASDEKDDNKKKKLMQKAVFTELAAQHFLTDLFSGGHVRVPIDELEQYAQRKWDLGVGATLKLLMHTEDGKNGVWVTDATGDIYLATGDGTLFEKENAFLKNKVIVAAKIGMKEILDSFGKEEKKEENIEVKEENKKLSVYDLIPRSLTEEEVINHKKTQITPLFRIKDAVLQRRNDVNNPFDHNYIKDWTVAGTMYQGINTLLKSILPEFITALFLPEKPPRIIENKHIEGRDRSEEYNKIWKETVGKQEIKTIDKEEVDISVLQSVKSAIKAPISGLYAAITGATILGVITPFNKGVMGAYIDVEKKSFSSRIKNSVIGFIAASATFAAMKYWKDDIVKFFSENISSIFSGGVSDFFKNIKLWPSWAIDYIVPIATSLFAGLIIEKVSGGVQHVADKTLKSYKYDTDAKYREKIDQERGRDKSEIER